MEHGNLAFCNAKTLKNYNTLLKNSLSLSLSGFSNIFSGVPDSAITPLFMEHFNSLIKSGSLDSLIDILSDKEDNRKDDANE